MATYKIKRFSKFNKLELEDLRNSLPSEYLLLQQMNEDVGLNSSKKKAKYLNEVEYEFPYFELIPLEFSKKEDYQSTWKLPILYVDSLKTPIYYNFKKQVWENFQGRQIVSLKSYLFNLWNDAYQEWEDREYEDYLDEKQDVQFHDYTRSLIKAVRRYLY